MRSLIGHRCPAISKQTGEQCRACVVGRRVYCTSHAPASVNAVAKPRPPRPANAGPVMERGYAIAHPFGDIERRLRASVEKNVRSLTPAEIAQLDYTPPRGR